MCPEQADESKNRISFTVTFSIFIRTTVELMIYKLLISCLPETIKVLRCELTTVALSIEDSFITSMTLLFTTTSSIEFTLLSPMFTYACLPVMIQRRSVVPHRG